jgi:hypothetical protein
MTLSFYPTSMSSRRVGLVGASLAALALACSGGQSQDLPPQFTASQLDCLVQLVPYCCESDTTPTCIPTFTAAKQCGAWPAGDELSVYATPCQGMTAVRVIGSSFSTFYVYDSTGALYAVGDNAASPDPRSGAIECGAGPKGFVIPTACANAWQGPPGSAACSAGTPAAASLCH